jgi:hypothetical protein
MITIILMLHNFVRLKLFYPYYKRRKQIFILTKDNNKSIIIKRNVFSNLVHISVESWPEIIVGSHCISEFTELKLLASQ